MNEKEFRQQVRALIEALVYLICAMSCWVVAIFIQDLKGFALWVIDGMVFFVLLKLTMTRFSKGVWHGIP